MKVIVFHGTGCKPEDFWYPWIKEELEKQHHRVEVPAYPDMNRVPIDKFLPKVLANHDFDAETVLVGHSAGVPLILSILETIEQKVAKVVLIAGFSEPLDGPEDPILQPAYQWDKIRAHTRDTIIINSDNDPWGCDDKQGKKIFDKLGGTLVIRHDGHFGSQSKGQPYKEFPLLKTLIEGQV